MESDAARPNKKSQQRLRSRRRTAISRPKNFSESLLQRPHLNPVSAPPSRDPKADEEQSVVAVPVSSTESRKTDARRGERLYNRVTNLVNQASHGDEHRHDWPGRDQAAHRQGRKFNHIVPAFFFAEELAA